MRDLRLRYCQGRCKAVSGVEHVQLNRTPSQLQPLSPEHRTQRLLTPPPECDLGRLVSNGVRASDREVAQMKAANIREQKESEHSDFVLKTMYSIVKKKHQGDAALAANPRRDAKIAVRKDLWTNGVVHAVRVSQMADLMLQKRAQINAMRRCADCRPA